MSMENELKRIANSLERIEAKMGGQTTAATNPDPIVAPAPQKKKVVPVAKAEAVIADAPVAPAAEPVQGMTPDELMKYCNTVLTAVTDVEKRKGFVKQVLAVLKEQYGVSSIKDVPPGKIADLHIIFDGLVAGEEEALV